MFQGSLICGGKIRKIILISGLVVPLIYIGGIFSLSLLSGMDFNEIVLYKYMPVSYHRPFLAAGLIKPLTAISGLLLIACFPGILFAGLFFKNKPNLTLTKLFSLGLVLNISLLFLGTTLLKLLGITVNRFWFTAVVLVFSLVGLFLFSKTSNLPVTAGFSKYKSEFFYALIILFILLVFIIFFHDSLLRPLPVEFNYSPEFVSRMDYTRISDFHDRFGIAHHLRNRLLPYWLIPSLGRFGVFLYWPSLSCFFLFFATTLFGESYAAINLLSLVFAPGIFLFTYKVVSLGKNRTANPLLQLGLGFFMFSFLTLLMKSIRRGDVSFMEWPENCLGNVMDYLWVFLLIGLIFFLLQKDAVFTLIFSFLATFCRYESAPCVFILILLYYYFFKDKEERAFLRKFSKFYFIFFIGFAAFSTILCLSQRGGWRYFLELLYNRTFIRFDFTRRLICRHFDFITAEEKTWMYFNWNITLEFIRTVLASTYFFVVLFLVPTRDKITGFISLFGIIFLLILIPQSHKLICYSYLLLPLAAVNIRRFVFSSVRVKLFYTGIYAFIYFVGRSLIMV